MQDPATFQAVKPHFPELEQLKCPRCDSTNTKFCYYNNYNLSQPRHFCKNCRRYWTKGGALRNIPVGGGTRKNAAKKRQKADPDPNRTRKAQETPQHPASTMAAVAVTSTSSSQEAISSSVGRGGGGSDNHPGRLYGLGVDPDHKMLDITGSFSSLLATNGGFGTVLDGLNPTGSGLKMAQLGGFGESFGSGQNMGQVSGRGSGFDVQSDNNGGGSLMQSGGGNGGDSSCWGGSSNGWPDLAIYTPSSNFQ